MRSRLVVVLCLLMGAFVPAAHAGAPRSELVLVGRGTASTLVSFKTPVVLDPTKAQLLGASAFVGFYAERVDVPIERRTQTQMHSGVVRMRGFRADGGSDWVIDLRTGRDTTLSAGRWRIYLIASGPSEVRIPWNGPPLRLAPAARTYASAVVRSQFLMNPLTGDNRQPLEVRGARALTLSSLGFGKFRVFAGSMAACLALPADECGSASSSGVDQGFTGAMEYPTTDATVVFTVIYDPGMIRPGRYDALQSVTNATTLQFAAGAAFTLALA